MYTIVGIHEVCHLPESQRKEGLFGHVNKWLKIKQESGSYLGRMQTKEDKMRYIQQYMEHEGIKLDPMMIVKSPRQKATAKLMLNSFWRKLGERMNKLSVDTISSPAASFLRVSDRLLKIHCIRICTSDMLQKVYTCMEDNALNHLCSRIHNLSGLTKIVPVLGKAG